ncbi:MAG: stage III sporulation protein AB [Eubacteriales bacterium]
MLQIIGGAFILLGSIGIGQSMVEEIRTKQNTLIEYLHFFDILHSEISYSRETIPDACGKIGQKIDGKLGEYLKNIQVEVEQGNSFPECWRQQMEQALQGIKIDAKFKKHMLEFPSYVGFADSEMQCRAVNGYMEDISVMKSELEDNMKDQIKMIHAISVSCGMMIAIILW